MPKAREQDRGMLLASQEDASLGMALPAHSPHGSRHRQQIRREKEGLGHLTDNTHQGTAAAAYQALCSGTDNTAQLHG